MTTAKGLSLRQVAKELGVSHTLLSLWKQGKRNLSPELEAGYNRLVTTSGYKGGYIEKASALDTVQLWREREGVEPPVDTVGCPPADLKSVKPTRAHPLPGAGSI